MDENNIDKLLIDDERISLFMQGKMSAEEEALFKEELKSNTELRQRAISQARLVKGMKQADEELVNAFKQADRQTIIDTVHNSNKSANAAFNSESNKGFTSMSEELFGDDKSDEKTNKRFSRRWLAYAASFILIVFVGIKAYDYYDTTSLGKQYANAFPIESMVRGDVDTDVEKELTQLFNNVSKGEKLKDTTVRLAELWEIAKQDTYNSYTDYAPYIGWNLAIGYLEDYEKANASAILKELSLLYGHETALGSKVNELTKRI